MVALGCGEVGGAVIYLLTRLRYHYLGPTVSWNGDWKCQGQVDRGLMELDTPAKERCQALEYLQGLSADPVLV
jgi:hypothetical protein